MNFLEQIKSLERIDEGLIEEFRKDRGINIE
jgi:hypothetical protein